MPKIKEKTNNPKEKTDINMNRQLTGEIIQMMGNC